MKRWLGADVYRFRVGGRQVPVKRHHVLLIVLLALAAIVLLAAGVFAGRYVFPYKVRPAPPIPPGQKAPGRNCPHTLGGCLPKPTVQNTASILASSTGPDFSNNDPVSCSQIAAIARRNSFFFVKVNEGTGFVDRTAAGMVACAKAHGLAVGGYDFFHVCQDSAAAEAALAVGAARQDGLLAGQSFGLSGDAEYPSSTPCNVRAWLATWYQTVYRLTGRRSVQYTGAWWWQPHVGCWWYGNTLSWVSGYQVRFPFMPCGRTQLDIWQFADNGFNGATQADLSLWRDGPAAFALATGGGSPQPVRRTGIFPAAVFVLAGGVRASERNTVKTWDGQHCRNPARRPLCKSSHLHLQLLADRIWFVAHHHVVRGRWVVLAKPRWGYTSSNPLGARFQGIERRLHQT